MRDLSAQTGLIAVQGPQAAALLDKLAPDGGFGAVKPFHFRAGPMLGVPCSSSATPPLTIGAAMLVPLNCM